MEKERYEILFKEIIKQKHGMNINFEKGEEALKHLREGGALSYSDLEALSDPACWPFKKYWMWPSCDQIKGELEKTKGFFVRLPQKEDEIIKRLDAIFKNIALVSIILRFAYPEYYAIYSRPPLKILRIERGANDVEEYLNYVLEMRILRRTFGVPNTSEVDMIVWVIAQKKGQLFNEFMRLIAEELPENLTPEQIIIYLAHEPLKIAETYFRHGDYKTAGMWAGKAFERFLYREYSRIENSIPGWQSDGIKELVDSLCETDEYRSRCDILHRLRRYRNRAIHVNESFSEEDAENFLSILKNLFSLRAVRTIRLGD